MSTDTMTSILIKLIHDLKNIDLKNKFFKKLRKRISIRKSFNSFYKYIYKDIYTAKDIIDICTLFNTAKTLNLDISENNTFNIHLIKNSKDETMPIIGVIEVHTDYIDIIFKAYVDNNILHEGNIDIKWLYNNKAISYSRTIEYLDRNFHNIKDSIDYLQEQSYTILLNTMIICVEQVVAAIEYEYIHKYNIKRKIDNLIDYIKNKISMILSH